MVHDHCLNCFQMDCEYQPCTLIRCKYGCKFKMHKCKENDHQYVCSKVKVPCINAMYGCDQKMLKMNLSEHLIHCPASVVVCPAEWNRYSASSKTNLNSERFICKSIDNSGSNLELAFAYRDQTMLNDLRKYRKISHLLQKFEYRMEHPVVPIEPYLSGRKALNKTQLENFKSDTLTKCSSFASNASNTASTFTNSDEDNSESPINIKKSPPGLSRSLCEKLARNKEMKEEEVSEKEDFTSSDTEVGIGGFNFPTKIKKEKKKFKDLKGSLILDLVIEFLPYLERKAKYIFTFRCASDFRRDEFCGHYQTVHWYLMITI